MILWVQDVTNLCLTSLHKGSGFGIGPRWSCTPEGRCSATLPVAKLLVNMSCQGPDPTVGSVTFGIWPHFSYASGKAGCAIS